MFELKDGRLFSQEKLTPDDFTAIATILCAEKGFARKPGDKPMAAMRIADSPTLVITYNTDGGNQQTRNIAKPGDAILTRLNKDGTVKYGSINLVDEWVVKAADIDRLYTRLGTQCAEYGERVAGNNEGWYIDLPQGGEIEAPWGGRQEIGSGVLFCSSITGEVYLNEIDAFDATYIIEQQANCAA